MRRGTRVTPLTRCAVALAVAVAAAHADATPAGATVTFAGGGLGVAGPIAHGPDGATWFLGFGDVGRITTAGQVQRFPLGGSNLSGIVAGPDGNLWISDTGDAAIARLTPAGMVTKFPVPHGNPPGVITAGPGGAVWFADDDAEAVDRIDVSGAISSFPVGVRPWAIAAGADGNIWFTAGDSVYRMTSTGALTRFAQPGSPDLHAMTGGPDGNLWFVEIMSAAPDRIARITPAGAVTGFALAPAVHPTELAAGSDGNVWFAEEGSHVDSVTPAGAVTRYALPVCGVPAGGLAAGAGGSIWFTLPYVGQLGVLTPADRPGGCRPYVPHCQGRARKAGRDTVRFHWRCADAAPVFSLKANRRLRSVKDPSGVFGCDRAGASSFRCNDVHSEQDITTASGRVRVRGAVACRGRRRMSLRIKAFLISPLPELQLRPLTFRLPVRC